MEQDINLEEVKKLPFELRYIVKVLELAFKAIDERSKGDLVIVLGQTGDGKSTMLASLMYGAGALEEVETKQKVMVEKCDNRGKQIIKDGVPQFKSKMMKTKVIDYNKEHRKRKNLVFGIGHSKMKSCTFLPNWQTEPGTGLVLTDVAGLQDTSGDLIEVINSLIIKRIFMKAESLRFIVPISYNSIKDERGNRMRLHGNLIKRTFKDDLNGFVPSVQPLVTKCSAKDKVDGAALRKLVGNILQKEIDQERLKMEKEYREA